MMSEVECPACHSRTAETAIAYDNGEDCPSCGLSIAPWTEVLAVRERAGSEELKSRVAELLVENERLKADLALARVVVAKASGELARFIYGEG